MTLARAASRVMQSSATHTSCHIASLTQRTKDQMRRRIIHSQAALYANRIMNRPDSRQQRPPRTDRPNHAQVHKNQPRPAQKYNGSVPSVQKVLPGASVSIVLKEDQPTGREVQGVVKDLLTRGNHPRGIKVRLQDGKVGRVQRMIDSQSNAVTPENPDAKTSGRAVPEYKMVRDVREEDEYLAGPPARSLADFVPDFGRGADRPARDVSEPVLTSAIVKCPICGTFEGDETAVSHHVEEHLS